MADPARHPDTPGDTGVRPTEDRPPGMPVWVKVSGIIAAILVLLIVLLMFAAGGDHGPGLHTPGGDTPPVENGPSDGPGGHRPPFEH